MPFEYDEDDPPPQDTWLDHYWFVLHRFAELCMHNPLVVQYAKQFRLY